MGVAYLPPVRKAFEELRRFNGGAFRRIGTGANHRSRAGFAGGAMACAQTSRIQYRHPSIDVRLSSVIWDNAVLDEATDLEIPLRCGSLAWLQTECLLNQSILAVCSPTLLRTAQQNGDKPALLPGHLIHIMGFENHGLKVRAGAGTGGGPRERVPTSTPRSPHWSSRRPAPASHWRIGFFWTPISRPDGWCWRSRRISRDDFFLLCDYAGASAADTPRSSIVSRLAARRRIELIWISAPSTCGW